MADINVRFEMSFSRRQLASALALLLISLTAPELGSESVTLSTYYPAPSGIYAKMITTDNTQLARAGGSVQLGTTATLSTTVNALPKLVVMGGNVGIGVTSPDDYDSTSAADATLHLVGGNYNTYGTVAPNSGDIKIGDAAQNFKIGLDKTGGGGLAGDVRLTATGTSERIMIGHANGGVHYPTLTVDSGKVGINYGGETANVIYSALEVGNANGQSGSHIIVRQNNCSEISYTTGQTACGAGYFVTTMSGIMVKYMYLGYRPSGNNTGSALCCPCQVLNGSVCTAL
jgi:hypothetical protein